MSTTASIRTFFRELVESIRGSEQDFTTGGLRRAIFLLAVPMVLEMVMESVFAVVDVYFVSSLGASAVATVGLTESILTLIYAVSIGLAMGTTAMVARRVGEKDREAAANVAAQAITVGLIGSIPIMLIGIFCAPDVLRIMGADEWSVNYGASYTRWMLGGNVTIMLLFIINAVFRGAGDAAIAMRVLWLANGINVFLDPALITGWGPFPEMGIKGAAVATCIGRGIGVVYQLITLFGGRGRLNAGVANMRIRWDVMWRLIRVSLGGILQFVIATSSWIGLMRIMAQFGSDALAGYTVAVRVAMFTILPAWGFSNAAATLVGQNLGAKRPDRAEQSVWLTGIYNMAFLLVVGAVFVIFAEDVVRIFSNEPRVVEVGAAALRIFAYGYPLFAWGLVMMQAFNGSGDTWTPTYINLVCFWMLEIPLAWVLAVNAGMHEPGVVVAVVIAEGMAALVGMWLFRRGKWKTREV